MFVSHPKKNLPKNSDKLKIPILRAPSEVDVPISSQYGGKILNKLKYPRVSVKANNKNIRKIGSLKRLQSKLDNNCFQIKQLHLLQALPDSSCLVSIETTGTRISCGTLCMEIPARTPRLAHNDGS